MTGGTSQGLFVVVAIVIFGLFVGISYTVFGDTLQPALVTIFTDAINLNDDRLDMETYTKVNAPYTFMANDDTNVDIISQMKNSIHFKTDDKSYHGDGIFYESSYFQPQRNYILSYDLTVVDGRLDRIGGHLPIAENIAYFVNGVELPQKSEWTDLSTAPIKVEKGEKVNIKVYFDTNHLTSDDIKDKRITIQPNRFQDMANRNGYEVKISDLTIYERHNIQEKE